MFTSQTSRGGYNLCSEPDLKYSVSTINLKYRTTSFSKRPCIEYNGNNSRVKLTLKKSKKTNKKKHPCQTLWHYVIGRGGGGVNVCKYGRYCLIWF